MNLLLLIPCLLNVVLMPVVSQAAAIAKPGCSDSCGGVKIPFPFGIGPRCYLNPWFEINCTSSSKIHPAKSRPKLARLKIEVLDINYDDSGTLTVAIPPLNMCSSATAQTSIDLRSSPYNFSTVLNVFTMRGCAGSSVLKNKGNKIIAGCATVCRSKEVESKATGGCYGVNCCQSPLTSFDGNQDPDSQRVSMDEEYMDYYKVHFDNQTSTEDTNYKSCLVSTLVQSSSVTSPFSDSSSTSLVPAVLVWNMLATDLDVENYLSDSHRPGSSCYIHNHHLKCYCGIVYEGNPYLSNGCQVVDVCKHCKGRCVPVFHENGSDTYNCEKKPLLTLATVLGLSIGAGVVLLVASCYWMYRFAKKRRVMKRKAKFFKQNGGLLLQQQLSSKEGGLEKAKVFSSDDLETATHNFNEDRILGQGGQGTVYKGMLIDGRIVAIKKSKHVDESQISQFINEVVILSQVNHRHVVKLLGCCLESEVPLLVYEYISNGTLAQHIDTDDEDHLHLTWKMRLKIASESAGAVAYLHSSSSPPIYHRDIKSSNILLDEKNRAKVADFGSSKTIALDQTHLTTVVQGTMGYLDPEYFQTYQFTDKSDVYSFGVVLLELLTSKRPIFRGELMEQKNLVTEFLIALENNRLVGLLDPQVLEEAEDEAIRAVTDLARRCLNANSKMRPTMKEVTMVLEKIIQSPNQVVVASLNDEDSVLEEAEQYLTVEEIVTAENQPTSTTSSVQDTISIDEQPLISHWN